MIKRNILFIGFIVVIFLLTISFSVYASSSSNTISNCIRSCNEYKKIEQKSCSTDYISNLSKCRTDYKTCLKSSRDITNLRNCLKTYNNCTKSFNIEKRNCDKNVTSDFLDCKGNCLSPQTYCIKEGEKGSYLKNDNCCENLTKISVSFESDSICENSIDSSFICSKCGNGICEKFENSCNCKTDCSPCKKEGESIPVIMNAPICCNGLNLILPKQQFIVGISGICTDKCGNGICDNITENNYNCPIDCKLNNDSFCSTCGNSCTTNINEICPMTLNTDSSFAPVNFECKIINGTCTKVNITDSTKCESNSDCQVFFSHCGCNHYCKNKNYFPIVDCERACSIDEIVDNINSCKCENNKCVGIKKENNCIGVGKTGNTCSNITCCSGLLRVDSLMGGACPSFSCIENKYPVCINDSDCSNNTKCFECHGFVNDDFVPVKHCYNTTEITQMLESCAVM